MDEAQAVYTVIVGVVALGGFAAVISRYTKPLHELNMLINELKLLLQQVQKEAAVHNERLKTHGRQIDDLSKVVNLLNYRVGAIEEKMGKPFRCENKEVKE